MSLLFSQIAGHLVVKSFLPCGKFVDVNNLSMRSSHSGMGAAKFVIRQGLLQIWDDQFYHPQIELSMEILKEKFTNVTFTLARKSWTSALGYFVIYMNECVPLERLWSQANPTEHVTKTHKTKKHKFDLNEFSPIFSSLVLLRTISKNWFLTAPYAGFSYIWHDWPICFAFARKLWI